MSVFDIKELREQIFSYVYPKLIKKGMWIVVLKSICVIRPRNYVPLQIFKIVKNEDQSHTIIIKYESIETRDDNKWYCVYSYLYPDHGDVIKVIKVN
jgi:hypothetical protein